MRGDQSRRKDAASAGEGYVLPAGAELIWQPKTRRSTADTASKPSTEEQTRKDWPGRYGSVDRVLSFLNISQQWLKRIAVALLLLYIIKEIVDSVTFNLFIIEEAEQRAGFPIYTDYKEGNYGQMHTDIDSTEEIIRIGFFWTKWTGWINPLQYQGFTAYFNAAARAARSWRATACRHLLYPACAEDMR